MDGSENGITKITKLSAKETTHLHSPTAACRQPSRALLTGDSLTPPFLLELTLQLGILDVSTNKQALNQCRPFAFVRASSPLEHRAANQCILRGFHGYQSAFSRPPSHEADPALQNLGGGYPEFFG